jgi:hypothetical protein
VSQKSNVNPDHYKQAGRDRQGEDILHERERREWAQTGEGSLRKNEPRIPNQDRASQPRQPAGQDSDDADIAPRLTDDEGMID